MSLGFHEVRQYSGDLRENQKYSPYHHIGETERYNTPENSLLRDMWSYTLHHKAVDADRRCKQSDFAKKNRHDPKPDAIVPEIHKGWIENRKG